MGTVPSGFSRREVRGASLVLADALADALVAAGMDDPESLRPRAARTFEGRGRPFAVDIPGAGSVVVRQYLHGGALRSVTGDLYRGEERFAAELAVLSEATRAGVPVPEALGFASRAGGLGLRRGWLLTREVAGARDLLAWLADEPRPAERRNVLAAAGRAMRTLHDAGIEHPDLHWKNLLVTPEGKVVLLDLDRARRTDRVSRDRRIAGLFRFDRFAAKRAAAGARVSRTDRLRVLRAYAGADWPGRHELRVLALRLARHIVLHRSRRPSRREAAPR